MAVGILMVILIGDYNVVKLLNNLSYSADGTCSSIGCIVYGQ